jgi:hypothetical protein
MNKPFSWSFSKYNSYETCPLRHYEVDICKNWSDGDSEVLKWGTAVHEAIANCLQGKADLPKEMEAYQKWVDRVITGPGELHVEQKYALDRSFSPCSWFSPTAWVRAIGDAVRVDDVVALGLDWKTGKPKEDSIQLAILAQCLFSYYPTVKLVRTEFVWLAEGDATTSKTFSRDDIAKFWRDGMLAKVAAMEEATKLGNFPPRPSGLCKRHCPVKTCTYHGKGGRV